MTKLYSSLAMRVMLTTSTSFLLKALEVITYERIAWKAGSLERMSICFKFYIYCLISSTSDFSSFQRV